MVKRVAAVVMVTACAVGSAAGQGPAPAARDEATHRITVRTDEVYTGTLNMVITDGKVSGTMRITDPMEITGKLAGTASAGTIKLDFPFYVTAEKCSGSVKMDIKLPDAPGAAKGTVVALGCEGEADKMSGTVEITPVAQKSAR